MRQLIEACLRPEIPSTIIMGRPVMALDEWNRRKTLELVSREQNISLYEKPLHEFNSKISRRLKSSFDYEITVISSIYRPGELFNAFLGNLQEQTIFHKAEIVLLVVDSLESDLHLATKFEEEYPNVTLKIIDKRITIYEAWNQAIQLGTAPYITNMNVDDLRSPNSLEIQIIFMRSNPWVDVGYQDFYYLLDRELDWTSVVNIGAISQLTPVTLTELAWFGINAPHNGPIWKRELHQRFGLFDSSMRSAGDFEFWMRLASAGAIFVKMEESTIGYFLNPVGMSTSMESPSTSEEQALQEKYRDLIKLQSQSLPRICVDNEYLKHPWDGSEDFTEKVLHILETIP